MPRSLDRSPLRRGGALFVGLLCSSLAFAAATCSHEWDLLDSGTTGGACPAGQMNMLCTSVPRWPDGGEDAAILALTPDCLGNNLYGARDPSGTNVDAWAFIRAGWAEDGLHVVFDVTDPHPIPNAVALYEGAAVEIYAKGDEMTDGAFGDPSLWKGDAGDGGIVDRGATQLIIAAPSPDAGPLWGAFWGKDAFKPAGVGVSTERTAAGYRVEALLPWNVLSRADAGSVPDGGISLDFAIDVAGASPGAGRIAQLIFYESTDGGAASPECDNSSGAQPYCDDRLWCHPSLHP
jgi:hypothetical protein